MPRRATVARGRPVSLDPILWALKDAPVADSLERLVLVALAERAARADGCTAFPSRDTLAEMVLADPKTVQRVLGRLAKRGLIARGDQSAARYLRADRRPVVYDLMIPFSWFPNPERMNAERAQCGLSPLMPEDRPDIEAAPARARRSDVGQARTARGDSKSPRHGGTASPERGDWESPTGGLAVPRTTSRTTPGNHPVPPSGSPAPAPAPAAGRMDGQCVVEGGDRRPAPTLATPAAGAGVLLEVARRQPALALSGDPLLHQALAVEGRIACGWAPEDLVLLLAGDPPDGMRSPSAVVAARVARIPAAPVAVPRQIPAEPPVAAPPRMMREAHAEPPPSCATCPGWPAPGRDQCAACLDWPTCGAGCGARVEDGGTCPGCAVEALERALAAPETADGTCPGTDGPCGRPAVTLGWCARCRVAAQAALVRSGA